MEIVNRGTFFCNEKKVVTEKIIESDYSIQALVIYTNNLDLYGVLVS
jgi:hypothetical protein